MSGLFAAVRGSFATVPDSSRQFVLVRVCLQRFTAVSGSSWQFTPVRDGSRWFAAVCGGSRWFTVVCGICSIHGVPSAVSFGNTVMSIGGIG